MAKRVDALASNTSRPSVGVGATPIRGVPLWKLPRSVKISLADRAKQLKQAAFERRYHARALLFGKGGGSIQRLSREDARYVRFVWEEAYAIYLHRLRTGERRFQGWSKRELVNREPMSKRGHYNQWWRAQKARYIRFDLPKNLGSQR